MKLTSFFILPCLILCIFISSACQPTPKSPIVIEKGDLSEHIAQQAEPEIDGSRPGEARLQFEKTYDSGNSVFIDAPLLQPASSQAPVASVQAKPFVSGDGLEQMVRAFYPNATVYAHNMLTKTDIEKEIIFYKELLFREENGLDPVTGGPVAPGDEGPAMELSGDSEASTRDRLQATIEKYEEEYKIAPADSDLPQTDYVLKDMGSSYQLNLRAVDGSAIATIDFVNWEVGSNFYISLSEYDQSVSKFTATYQPPQELDENRAQELAMVQQCLESIGIDYMAPASANLGERLQCLLFCPGSQRLSRNLCKDLFRNPGAGCRRLSRYEPMDPGICGGGGASREAGQPEMAEPLGDRPNRQRERKAPPLGYYRAAMQRATGPYAYPCHVFSQRGAYCHPYQSDRIGPDQAPYAQQQIL